VAVGSGLAVGLGVGIADGVGGTALLVTTVGWLAVFEQQPRPAAERRSSHSGQTSGSHPIPPIIYVAVGHDSPPTALVCGRQAPFPWTGLSCGLGAADENMMLSPSL